MDDFNIKLVILKLILKVLKVKQNCKKRTLVVSQVVCYKSVIITP